MCVCVCVCVCVRVYVCVCVCVRARAYIYYIQLFSYMRIYNQCFLTYHFSPKKMTAFIASNMRGRRCGVVVNELDCNIVISEFALQSCYITLTFGLMLLGKGMNSLIPQAIS